MDVTACLGAPAAAERLGALTRSLLGGDDRRGGRDGDGSEGDGAVAADNVTGGAEAIEGPLEVLGFAFAHDAARLASVAAIGQAAPPPRPLSLSRRPPSPPAEDPTAATAIESAAPLRVAIEAHVVDLQRAAHAAGASAPGGGPPSLRAACARFLGGALDKTCQCSDWDARPLSDAQCAYAALDAAVLLRLRASLARGVEQEEKGGFRGS